MSGTKGNEGTSQLPGIRTTITRPRGKHWAIAFIEKLPDDVTFTEICYMLILNRMIEHSIEEAEKGGWVSNEEVKALIDSWRESPPPPPRTPKEELQDMANDLPDDACWDDIAFAVFEKKSFLDSHRGIRDWGPVISKEEVEKRFPNVDPYSVTRVRRVYTSAYRKDSEVWNGWVENLPGAEAQGADIQELRASLVDAAKKVIEEAQARSAVALEGAEFAMREEMEVVVEVAHTFIDRRDSKD